MMRFFSSLLSSEKIVNAGIKTADALAFTQEERANFLMEYAKATAPMNVARRFIAVMITVLWCLGVIIACVLLFFGNPGTFEKMAQFLDDTINMPFSIVMGFYFLAHVMQRGKK